MSKASEDDAFRASLMNDPASAISTELGVEVPEDLTVRVHQDSQSEVNLVLPPKQQLSGEELGGIAGGGDYPFQMDW